MAESVKFKIGDIIVPNDDEASAWLTVGRPYVVRGVTEAWSIQTVYIDDDRFGGDEGGHYSWRFHLATMDEIRRKVGE